MFIREAHFKTNHTRASKSLTAIRNEREGQAIRRGGAERLVV